MFFSSGVFLVWVWAFCSSLTPQGALEVDARLQSDVGGTELNKNFLFA